MDSDLERKVAKLFEDVSIEELIQSPIFAIRDVKEKDVLLLKKAFNIKTVKNLAELKYVRWAQDFCQLAEKSPSDIDMSPFKDQLIKKYEHSPVSDIIKAPVYALQGVSENDAELLKMAFNIVSVEDLGKSEYILRAQEIAFYKGKKKKLYVLLAVSFIIAIMVLYLILV
ncbi:MAG: hypothetical protein IEMM0008_0621 [bacterium]|nr:MAG: hypothetical protein IEMM0008_0621 [bacterium]